MSSDNQDDSIKNKEEAGAKKDTSREQTESSSAHSARSSQITNHPSTNHDRKPMLVHIIGAIAIVIMICAIVSIIVLVANRNTSSSDPTSIVAMENVCDNYGGIFEEEGDRYINIQAEIKSTTYNCVGTDSNKDNFRVMIIDRDVTTAMEEIANQNDYSRQAYQEYVGQPGGFVKYLFGQGNSENKTTIVTIKDTPIFFKGRLQMTSGDNTVEGDYYSAYKNIVVISSNENTPSDLGFDK